MGSMDSPFSSDWPTPPSPLLCDYDVFISFLGEDTGYGSTSHLTDALIRKGIKLFSEEWIDGLELGTEEGHHMSLARFKAIEHSKLCLVVFSNCYGSSTRCLAEVVKILECSKKNNLMVMPVFYNVDPSDVRRQRSSYAEAFEKHEQEYKDDSEKVKSWRNALAEAASLSGWDCTVNVRTEHEIVEDIAKDVLEKLDGLCVGGLDVQIDQLEQLAQLQREISQKIPSSLNERNYKANLEHIKRLKIDKQFRLLRLTPDLLSHMKISKTTNTYF